MEVNENERSKTLFQPVIDGWRAFARGSRRLPLPWTLAALAAFCAHLAAVLLLGTMGRAPLHQPVPPYLEVSLIATETLGLPPESAIGLGAAGDTAPAQPQAGGEWAGNERAEQQPARQPAPSDKPLSAEPLVSGANTVIALPVAAAHVSAADERDPKSQAELLMRISTGIAQQIRGAWKVPYSAGPGTRAQVRLQLNRDGHIADLKLLGSNGSESFNTSIVRALQGLGGFASIGLLPEAVYLEQFQELVLVFDSESRRRL